MKPSVFIRVYPWLIISLPALAQTLTVLPPAASLSTPESRQQLIAEATVANHQEDWTAKVKWSSSNPQVATVDASGFVKPVSDGDAVIKRRRQSLLARSRFEHESFIHLELPQ